MDSEKKIIVVACEGQHDIAFIVRILLVSGFKIFDKKINEFFYPFNVQFAKIAESTTIADKKLGYQNPNYLLPSVALTNDEETTYIFLHNLSGDSKIEERQRLVQNYSDLVGEDDFTNDLNLKFRFLFFFDADELGVPARLSDVSQEMGIKQQLTNGSVVTMNDSEFGCYIYHENGSNTGVLEDLLLSYFSNKDATLDGNVNTFLSTNNLAEERTKELIFRGGVESYKGRSKYYQKKSKINIFGQLQFSGMNNTVIIAKSDFLRKSDIDACQQCQAMVSMFH